jgi:hypothetical protein
MLHPMSSHPLRLLRALALTLPLALSPSACKKENNIDQSAKEQNNTFTDVVNEDGGPVGIPAGPGGYVPSGALDEPTEITTRVASSDEYGNLPVGAIGEVYSFEPRGLLFNTEIEVFLPRPPGQVQHFVPYFSRDGQTWKPLSGEAEVELTRLHFRVLELSYFVAVDSSASMPDDGKGMAGGSPVGAGGGPGAAGTPNAGGTSGSNYCKPEPAKPSGEAELTGTLSDANDQEVSFDALDGFAVLYDMDPDYQLSLVFTDYPDACGTAMAGGQTLMDAGRRLRAGRAKGSAVGVQLMLPSAPQAGQTYSENLPLNFASFDAECSDQAGIRPGMVSVQVMEIDATHIVGTITIAEQDTGRSAAGKFDFSFCELPEAPTGRCCVQ